MTGRPITPPKPQEKGCWLYITNTTLPSTRKRVFQAAGQTWEQYLGRALGQKATLLQGVVKAKVPPSEGRLVLETPSKATRRMLMEAIKSLGGKEQAVAHLTPQEKACKALVYKQAQQMGLRVRNKGDICEVQCFIPGGGFKDILVQLDQGEKAVQAQMNRCMRRPGTPGRVHMQVQPPHQHPQKLDQQAWHRAKANRVLTSSK